MDVSDMHTKTVDELADELGQLKKEQFNQIGRAHV